MTTRTFMNGYRETLTRVESWPVKVVSYEIGDRYICVIDNYDAGATICRVSAATRDAAVSKGLLLARVALTKTRVYESEPAEDGTLAYLRYQGPDANVRYSVSEFMALTIGQRMEHILSGRLQYFNEHGRLMSPGAAMQFLREAA